MFPAPQPRRRPRHVSAVALLLLITSHSLATGLPARIDALIEAGTRNQPLSASADDAEFLRRIYLDFTGSIATAAEARAFFTDTSADKRTQLIDALYKDARFPRRLAELFNVMLMERRGDNAQWQAFLLDSFKANKPWDRLVADILNPNPRDEKTRAAAFFYTKRLEKEGEQPTDYPGLTRDVGRLFLGMDLQCAQCHDHLTVADYKQADFQGLFAFYQNISIHGASFPAVAEKPMAKKMEFASVFSKKPQETGPRVPTLPPEKELAIPALEKGKEFATPADAKTQSPAVPAFSPLAELARQLPAAENNAFARNIANRLWFVMMGRGLVHPLDLHHSKNPPSHPELLDLLAKEIIDHKFDIQWTLRELALTKTYQRSSQFRSPVPEGRGPSVVQAASPDRFTLALERRLSYEQILRSMLTATGELDRVLAKKDAKGEGDHPAYEDLRKRAQIAFAAEAKEAEENVDHSLKAALFVRNDVMFLSLLKPRAGNLMERLMNEKDAGKLADELYLCVLTRAPLPEEKAEVAAFLGNHADKREEAIRNLVWATMTSTEFVVNH